MSIDKVPDMGEDKHRAEEQRLRRRMLEGRWDEDLRQAMRVWLGPIRTSAIGKLSRSMNLFKSSAEQLAVSYEQEPVVTGEPETIEAFRKVLSDMKWVGLMRRHNVRVVGIRESLIKVQYAEATNRVTMRLVPPDSVIAKTDPDDVDRLVEVREARVRGAGDKADIYWDVHDCTTGVTTIEDSEGNDVTSEFAPDGLAVYTNAAGKPIKIWHLYHAEPSDKLWNAYDWCEIVDGAFDVATMWNGLRASLRDSSHAQRVMVDLDAPTATVDADGRTSVAPAGEDAVLMLRTTPGSTGGSINQWTPPVNPKDIAESILTFQKTLLATVRLFPGDLQEKRSESGVAIEIKRSAQRRFAQSMEPQLRESDVGVLTAIAQMHNGYVLDGERLAEDGYGITYRYLDDPVGDRVSEVEYNALLVSHGWLSQAQAYRAVHPGVQSDEDALTMLIRARMQENALKAASMGKVLIPDEVVDAYEAASNDTRQLLDVFPDLPAEVVAVLQTVADLTGPDEKEEQ